MKNIVVLIFFVVVAFSNQVKAQYPIPSYNVTVTSKATFEESEGFNSSTLIPSPRRIRNLIVHTTVVHQSISEPNMVVWLYTLDNQTTYGPYIIEPGRTIFEIDNRQWGVSIKTDQEILVDVWIE